MPQVIERTVEVNAPVETCFRLWNDPDMVPKFMQNVDNVREVSDTVWHWQMRSPSGQTFEFDSQIDQFEQNRLVAWHAQQNNMVDAQGRVEFLAQDGRTRVQVAASMMPKNQSAQQQQSPQSQQYAQQAMASEQTIEQTLARFKELAEQQSQQQSQPSAAAGSQGQRQSR